MAGDMGWTEGERAMGLVIGVDIGGTKVAAAVVDEAGVMIEKLRVDTPVNNQGAVNDAIAELVWKLREKHERVCLLSGGEVTVHVEAGGIGGRNQHFALYCAPKIAGENIAVLSAGTDGIDGNSSAAGAIVDGTTLQRAADQQLSAERALAAFDGFPLFERLHDLVITGPTANNVRDLRLLLAY